MNIVIFIYLRLTASVFPPMISFCPYKLILGSWGKEVKKMDAYISVHDTPTGSDTCTPYKDDRGLMSGFYPSQFILRASLAARLTVYVMGTHRTGV
ncbi:uncharacterized protein EAE97_000184 [Botrytis byssoidea]|uniref:Uncharacterized protein n=1 Tax=Botrytis byssoidea TaxID=139641 RepID=A0A9P5IX54_9HELO|nr:uncharacterized protein EAE97_000184 [Botrytis byssoidea]KAF7954925.1 hypothetical protein EAE97_000184 [Botrytis byssoidea]